MSTKTKILVFKMKEIIYTIVFAVLAILLIIFLVLIIKGHSKKSSESAKKSTFSPGIYEASIVLSSNPVNIEVVVDHEQINQHGKCIRSRYNNVSSYIFITYGNCITDCSK